MICEKSLSKELDLISIYDAVGISLDEFEPVPPPLKSNRVNVCILHYRDEYFQYHCSLDGVRLALPVKSPSAKPFT